MLKKSMIFVAALSCMVTFAFTGAAMADNGPEVLTLTTAAAKKPAVFSHKKHQDMMKCDQCHHTKGADGKQAPLAEGQAPAKCETCHNATMTNKKVDNFMKAAHENCKGCHKAGYEGKNGPTKCDGCHPKK